MVHDALLGGLRFTYQLAKNNIGEWNAAHRSRAYSKEDGNEMIYLTDVAEKGTEHFNYWWSCRPNSR